MKCSTKRLLALLLTLGLMIPSVACTMTDDPSTTDTAGETTEEIVNVTTEMTEESTDWTPDVMNNPEKAEKIRELLDLKHELRVNEDGSFKVLVLSDVQFNTASISKETRNNIETIVSREQPDLVIFNGDNSFAINHEKTMEKYVANMTRYLEENKIPWAHVYGNHDAEPWRPALDRETQQEIYESFDYCVSKAGDEDLFGVGNFVLPVLEHDSDKIAFNIWCFDSGTGDIYTDAHAATDVTVGDNTFWSHYETMEMNQVEWFRESSALLEEYNDAPIPGMMAFHIPLQETYYAWAAKETDNLEWTGVKRENISAHAQDVPLFEAAKENNILAIVNSHDHINDFMVKYQGIRLCYTACIGTYEYHADDLLGGRVVEFNTATPDDVNTYMSYVNQINGDNRVHESIPTPEAGSEGHISSFITNQDLTTYLTFDGNITDECGGATASSGTLTFTEGYFGQSVMLDNGYVSIPNYAPGTDSFTVSLWVNTKGVTSDPSLFANKDWGGGKNPGYILSINEGGGLKFNVGDSENRADLEVALPADFRYGWMHIALVVDRTAEEVKIAVDFGEFNTLSLPEALSADSFDALDVLNIGQDGTGSYDAALTASVDEFMVFDGALTQEDLAKLADYYGK